MESILQRLYDIANQLYMLRQPSVLDWVVAIGPVLTLFIIGFYIFQFSKNHGKQRCEKAIEYAKEYSEKILINIEYIDKVYELAGLRFVQNLNPYSIKFFDKDEYNSFCCKRELADLVHANHFGIVIEKIIQRGKINDLIARRSRLPINSGARLDSLFNSSILIDSETLKHAFIDDLKLVRSNTLNTLEYMAMYFTTQIAAKKVVYKSLHNIYIRSMVYFYGYLADPASDRDRYYPHVIKLFNMWNQKYFKKERRRKKREESAFLGLITYFYSSLRSNRRRRFRKKRAHYNYRIK